MSAGPAKIVLVAFDAADKDILLEGARVGRFPALRSLLDRSVWGTVANPTGLYVGAVWPSFYTGTSPARHGRYCFRQLRAGTYEVHRLRPDEVRADPFWRRLSEAKRRVAIIDVPKTRPDERLNGLQVVDWATHDPDFEGALAWPPALLGEIESSVGPRIARVCDAYPRGPGLGALRAALLEGVEAKARLSETLLARGGWDLFLTVFAESHCAGHQFWHLHDPSHPRHADGGTTPDPLLEIYAALDAALARLMAQAGGEAKVIVLASHGMGPHYGGNALLDEILRRREGAPLRQPTWSVRRALLRAWRLTPASLRSALRPLRDRIVRRLDEAIVRVDGSRHCFEVPNNDAFGGIRVNVAGRDPSGTIAPGAQFESFCEDLTRDLLDLVNPATGRPAVLSVLRSAHLYDGPHRDHLPDLLVEWNQEAAVEAVSSTKTGLVVSRYEGHRSGDHRPTGLFLACGPGLRPQRLPSPVSIMDFAPSLCRLLGVEPQEMDGRPIVELSE